MEHEELEQRTYQALEHARSLGLGEDDLSLLAWHCGLNTEQIGANNEQIRQH